MVTSSSPRRSWRLGRPAPWSHRVFVVVVTAAIVAAFFVPLPHASLFNSFVRPTKVRTPTTASAAARPLPAVDLSATPAGWVPVADADAQISVPSKWWVFYPGGDWCNGASEPGSVYLATLALPMPTCAQSTPNAVFVRPIVPGDHAVESPPPHHVNGLLVWNLEGSPTAQGGSYLVPSLGVVVTATGPLARRVLATITRSPRTVALAAGSAPVISSSWRVLTFAGVRFSVPASWPVQRSETWKLCPPFLVAISEVTLDTDKTLEAPFCAGLLPFAIVPSNGLRVDAGAEGPTGSFSRGGKCLHLGGLTACPSSTPDYSVLFLKVTVPDRSKPVFVSIGLSGNGKVARTILYSFRGGLERLALLRADGRAESSSCPVSGSS